MPNRALQPLQISTELHLLDHPDYPPTMRYDRHKVQVRQVPNLGFPESVPGKAWTACIMIYVMKNFSIYRFLFHERGPGKRTSAVLLTSTTSPNSPGLHSPCKLLLYVPCVLHFPFSPCSCLSPFHVPDGMFPVFLHSPCSLCSCLFMLSPLSRVPPFPCFLYTCHFHSFAPSHCSNREFPATWLKKTGTCTVQCTANDISGPEASTENKHK